MESSDKVKNGLEHCINGTSCRGCPYCEECAIASDCNPMHKDLQDYIQQLEAQNAEQAERIRGLESSLMDEVSKTELIHVVDLNDDAIKVIQQLQADNAQLNRCIENMTDKLNAAHDETAKLQAERDAAVSELVGTCQVCRWEETEKCASCHFCEDAWNVHESNWEWRGVQKEDGNAKST